MKVLKNPLFVAVLFLILLFGGSTLYSSIEEWDYLDSLYFTVATVTTIGYGDFVPKTDVGKIFTLFFSFLGVGTAFYFFSLMSRSMLKGHHEKLLKHLEKKQKK